MSSTSAYATLVNLLDLFNPILGFSDHLAVHQHEISSCVFLNQIVLHVAVFPGY